MGEPSYRGQNFWDDDIYCTHTQVMESYDPMKQSFDNWKSAPRQLPGLCK